MKKIKVLSMILAIFCLSLTACKNGDPVMEKIEDEMNPEKQAYIVYEDADTQYTDSAKSFYDAFKKLGGTVTEVKYASETTDFSEHLNKAVNGDADIIFAPCSSETAVNLLKTADKLGVECSIIGDSSWETKAVHDAVKDTKLKVYLPSSFDDSETSSELLNNFVKGFKDWFEEMKDEFDFGDSDKDKISSASALGYDAYNMALSALKGAAEEKGGEMTSVDVARALWTVSYENSVTGKMQFDKNGDAIKNSSFIKKVGKEGFEFVKIQSIDNKTDVGEGADYGDTKGVALNKENKKITVGVLVSNGDNSSMGQEELAGIRYANSVDNKIKIGDDEYTVELYYPNAEVQDIPASIVEQKALITIGSHGSNAAEYAEAFGAAGVPSIDFSRSDTSMINNRNFYFKTNVSDSIQGAICAQFAWDTVK